MNDNKNLKKGDKVKVVDRSYSLVLKRVKHENKEVFGHIVHTHGIDYTGTYEVISTNQRLPIDNNFTSFYGYVPFNEVNNEENGILWGNLKEDKYNDLILYDKENNEIIFTSARCVEKVKDCKKPVLSLNGKDYNAGDALTFRTNTSDPEFCKLFKLEVFEEWINVKFLEAGRVESVSYPFNVAEKCFKNNIWVEV